MKKILLVDDYLPIVKSLAYILEDEGYKCILATNGKEALEKILEEKPDLVVTDFEMPVMNGYELSKKIRENLETKDLYIIASSGTGLPKEMMNYINESIPKGDSSELIERIKEILGGKEK